MIKVILKENVPGQGLKGAAINVSDGFARNYLIPQGKAIIATPEAVKQIEQEQKNKLDQEKKQTEINESLKNQLEKLKVEIKKKTKEGKLFGSVTSKDVAIVLEMKGIAISPKNIIINTPIKSVGTHIVEVELDKKQKTKLKIEVVD